MFILILGAGKCYGNPQDLYADIISTSYWNGNDPITIIVKITNGNQEVNTSINGSYLIQSDFAVFDIATIELKKGVGSLSTQVSASSSFTISIEGFSGEKLIQLADQVPVHEIMGELQTNTIWTTDNVYHIIGDLLIPENITLQIEEGSRIFIGEKVNIKIEGSIVANGTKEGPISFSSIDISTPWGGLQLSNISDTTFFESCFFINGGDNENYIFGHSDSQPLVMIENSTVNFNSCYFLDNPGKAIGGLNSFINLDQCILSRCDTGGEYHHCFVNISNSWYIDIPGNFNTDIDDNDALYFYDVHPELQEPSTVKNCFFIMGEDDCIDHNGAILSIENCWIENYFHEGIAASNYNEVNISNTLIKNCEQGIESGYGSSFLKADHCVFVENDVGIRFGDSYNWGCEGQMEITNSITYNNGDNIKNYDLLTQAPVEGAINISFSITNDLEYNNYPGCIEGSPDFDENYFLLPGSIGIGLATDGGNLGLINTSIGIDLYYENANFSIYPNPFKKNFLVSFNLNENYNVELYIFDFMGVLKYKKSFYDLSPTKKSLMVKDLNLEPGAYLLVLSSNEKTIETKKLIKID